MKLQKVWLSITVVLLLLLFFSPVTRTQSSLPEASELGLKAIATEDLQETVEFLAGANTRGRSIDTPGFAVAAGYVADRLQKLGLKPMGDDGSYFQRIPLQAERTLNESAYIATADDSFRAKLGDTLLVQSAPADRIEISAPAVFMSLESSNTRLPKGVKLSDFQGKMVFIENHITGQIDRDLLEVLKALDKVEIAAQFDSADGYAESFRERDNSPGWRFSFVEATLNQSPAAASSDRSPSASDRVVGLIDKSATQQLAERSGVKLPQASGSEEIAVSFGKKDITFFSDRSQKEGYQFETMNVVAMLEGSDPSLKSQVVGIGAHLDHLGVIGGEVYPGADDNASGVAALLEVAKALQENPTPPKRSVLFIFFTGEESQLLGSRYYSANPVIPHDRMVVFLNLDSVSRNHLDKAELEKVAYLDGASCWEGLDRAIERVASTVDLEIKPISKAQGLEAFDVGCDNLKAGLGSPSDHISFGKQGIPVALLFTGIHADYHSPTDTIDKVNFDKLTKVAKLSYLVLKDLGDREKLEFAKSL